MKIRQIRAFLAVVDHGGIRAASRAIFFSQPAVSRAISSLEEELHCQLFVRNAGGYCELTPTGRVFLPFARSIVEDIKRATESIEQIQGGDVGTVRVAISPFFPGTVISQALRLFRSKFQKVNLAIRDGLYASTMPALSENNLDFGITFVTENISWPNETFSVKRLFKVKQGAVANANHPIHKSQNLFDLAKYEHIIVASSFETARERLALTVIRQGLPWPVNVSIVDQQIHDMLLSAPDSLVIGYAPYTLQHFGPDSAVRPIRFEGIPTGSIIRLPPLACLLIQRAGIPQTSAAQYFQDCLLFALEVWKKDRTEIFD